jgi:hypothetical protein
MARPANHEYFIPFRTEHVAQGDIFGEIEFPLPTGEEVAFTSFGMLLNYTSSMLIGAEGTNREYRHPFRVMAPIFTLDLIAVNDARWTDQKIEQLRRADDFGGWMYPPELPANSERVRWHCSDRCSWFRIKSTTRGSSSWSFLRRGTYASN